MRNIDNENKSDVGNHVQEEPRVENDYGRHPEIEQPVPPTATPSIPAEMPPR